MHEFAGHGTERVVWPTRPGTRRTRRRERSRPRDNRPANATYVVGMPVPRDVARARFATFVRRALMAARDRGMTDRQIAKETGLAASTFHRWQRGEGRELPELEKVRAFCAGTGANLSEALDALGMSGRRDTPEPEPLIPPEMRAIMRRLADPNVPEKEKMVITEMLRLLARGGS